MVGLDRLRDAFGTFTGRMVLGVFTIHLVLVPLLFIGVLSMFERSFQSSFIDRARASAHLYGSIIEDRLRRNVDPATIAESLEEATLGSEVIFVEYQPADGPAVRPSGVIGRGTGQEDFFFGQHGDGVYFIKVPILRDGAAPRGTLLLGYDELQTEQEIALANQRGYMFALAYVGMSLILVLFFGTRLSKPVAMLRDMSRAVTAGDHSVILDVPTEITEIRELARDLNLMRAGLLEQRQVVADRESRLQTIMDNVLEGIVVLQDDGLIETVNPATEEMFRDREENLRGRNVESLVVPVDREAVLGALAEADGRGHVWHEVMGQRADGSQLYLECAVRTVTVEGRTFPIVLFRDVTERRMVDESLRRSLKLELIGQLSSGLAHDFNNLLAIIKGNLEILKTKLVADRDMARRVDSAINGVVRGVSITRRLLDFSRRQAVATDSQIVNDTIEEMEDLLARSLHKRIDLDCRLADDLWRSNLDIDGFQDALLNLVLNARDAMPDGGLLTIRTENQVVDERNGRYLPELVPGEYVVLIVSDTGCGMSEEVQSQMFEPFFTTKEVGRGTGLGMSQVYGFVKRAEGHLSVQSEADRGTTISVYLPRAVQPAEAAAGRGPG